jgi:hypothetical protein
LRSLLDWGKAATKIDTFFCYIQIYFYDFDSFYFKFLSVNELFFLLILGKLARMA